MGPGSGGRGIGAGATAADPYVVGASVADDGPLGLANAALGKLNGIVWAVPSLALAVPGVLLLLAILAQVAAGAAWVPIVRRKLGSTRTAADRD